MPSTASREATHQDLVRMFVVVFSPLGAEANWVATKTLSCPVPHMPRGVRPHIQDSVRLRRASGPPLKQFLNFWR